ELVCPGRLAARRGSPEPTEPAVRRAASGPARLRRRGRAGHPPPPVPRRSRCRDPAPLRSARRHARRAGVLGEPGPGFPRRGLVARPSLSQRLGRPLLLLNLGVAGAGPVINLLNLRRLLAEGVRPDLVLIELMPGYLDQQQTGRELLPEVLPAYRLSYDEVG